MKIKLLLLTLVLLYFCSCGSSKTLIVGQLPDLDINEINPSDFIGKTIYVYSESEIKEFLESKNLDAKEMTSRLNLIRRKCDELKSFIPFGDSLNMAAKDKAESLASECLEEQQSVETSLNQMYFVNMPAAKTTTTIDGSGRFEVSVPSNQKYAVILPNHSITWVNAIGSTKFFMLAAKIDANSELVL